VPAAPDSRPLPRSFYRREAEVVARSLLGQVLVSTIGGTLTTGRIVETEAYIGPHDAASHAAERIGRTRRNESMFGEPGIAYVYRIYGVHWCLNVVTDRAEFPAAVLIRALEPLTGIDVMRTRRGPVTRNRDRELCSGPGKLAQALAITAAQDGHPLDAPPLMLVRGDEVAGGDIVCTTRVGITRAHDLPLRFFERGNPHVSYA
jgi:DNA-3-methyladenine glycosylase